MGRDGRRRSRAFRRSTADPAGEPRLSPIPRAEDANALPMSYASFAENHLKLYLNGTVPAKAVNRLNESFIFAGPCAIVKTIGLQICVSVFGPR